MSPSKFRDKLQFARNTETGRIPLPGGSELITLRDAATYITKLPKREHDAPEWQAAMQALLLVVEHGGDTILPRIGITCALRRYQEQPALTPRKKRTKAYRIVK